MDAFRTLARQVEAETREKGSRFLAIAAPVRDREDAERWLTEQARAHRDPTHVVPAFRLRDGTAYSSDAGEPAGSAGPPLLAALEGAGLSDVAAVVVRWYGGTKLGVGGLVRAYGGALAAALEGAPTRSGVRAVRLALQYPHARTAAVMRAVSAAGGRELEHGYAGDEATLAFSVPLSAEAAFAVALRDGTQGAVEARRVAETVLYTREG